MNDRALWPADVARAAIRFFDSWTAAGDAFAAAMPVISWGLVALAVAVAVLALRK
jgi:hypothetical protein